MDKEIMGIVIEDPRVLVANAYTKNSAIAYTKEKVGDDTLNFILPSSPAIFLNLALQAREQVVEVCKDELFMKVSDYKWQKNSRVLIDFFEIMMTQIIFSYSAIEAFANTSIPEDFIYHPKKKDNRFTESYKKEQTERYISLNEKLKDVLPNIFKVDSPTKLKEWNGYDTLQKLRDRIIHLKSSDTTPSTEVTKTIWGDLIRHQRTDFPSQAHALIGHFIEKEKEHRWFRMFPY
ncbi:hypothetical protein [Salmonirosea aquatica]|uniref:Uncharacterized protein n=1 Tax=Salmonirosea aquatica TaxID=2654236 RepID=A0A7C9BJM6_9BACT|nr:hypothetical protein [Cytophagaceae bacterium SJW1-29]